MSREKFNRMNKALVSWGEVLDEIEELAEQYDQEGWQTLILHPGDVVPRPAEDNTEPSFRLVVPDSELDELAKLVEEKQGIDEFEIHGAATDEVEYFLIILKSQSHKRAIFYPVFYDPDIDTEFMNELKDSQTVQSVITNLNKTQKFVFAHNKPSLFL